MFFHEVVLSITSATNESSSQNARLMRGNGLPALGCCLGGSGSGVFVCYAADMATTLIRTSVNGSDIGVTGRVSVRCSRSMGGWSPANGSDEDRQYSSFADWLVELKQLMVVQCSQMKR
jgi:hypothetical protein